MERLLITGATGFVGRYVVKEALNKGYEVHLIVRNPNKAQRLFSDRVKIHQLDNFLDREKLLKIIKETKPSYVIHLIGIIQEIKSRGITFERVHLEYPKILYDVLKSFPLKKIIHMSALGVDERAPSKYHITKLMAERELIKTQIPYAILRPSFILGPEQLLFLKLRPILEKTPLLIFPEINQFKFQPVDVRDVAECFIKAADFEENAIFDLCGDKRVTMSDIIKDFVSILDKKVIFIPFPKGILKIFAPEQLKMMWRDNTCEHSNNTLSIQMLLKREPIPYIDSIKWSALPNQ